MSMFRVKCPRPGCVTETIVNEVYIGRTVRCRKCGTTFVIRRPASAASAAHIGTASSTAEPIQAAPASPASSVTPEAPALSAPLAQDSAESQPVSEAPVTKAESSAPVAEALAEVSAQIESEAAFAEDTTMVQARQRIRREANARNRKPRSRSAKSSRAKSQEDTAMPAPEMIADYACIVGEGPLWHPDEQRLYWTDIDTGRLFRYDPSTGAHEQFYEGEPVGGFTIQEDGALLLFMARGAVKIWRDGSLETVVEEIPEERDSRFNDVHADPRGRVFCGTMPAGERMGRLHRLDVDGSLTPLLDEVGCSNGMAFTRDLELMYYTDSAKREIGLFEYDAETGSITHQKVFVTLPEGNGVPDGMTVDAEGHVWSALWDGNCLIRFAPDGSEVMRVPFPVKKVSSLTFGGPDYTDIYVTTAGGDQKETDGEHAGALFRVRLGIKGVPEFRSRVKIG